MSKWVAAWQKKAADQEKGDSCLIKSIDLNPVGGVRHFLTE